MTSADNPAGTPATPATATGDELSIPKHRFDEVNAELRRLREEQSLKDRLYMEERQRSLQQQQSPREVELTPEETGLDPTTHQAVLKVAKAIAGKELAKERAIFSEQIGMLAGRTEKAELLASKGADKAKYLTEIDRMQQEHFRRTGGFMPAEVCLDLLQSKEKDARIKDLEARLANPSSQSSAPIQNPLPTGGVPDASMTRQIPSGGQGAPVAKGFGEKTLAEMEAALEEQFKAGVRL